MSESKRVKTGPSSWGFSAVAALAALAAACGAPPEPEAANAQGEPLSGFQIAEANCASCHAIGREGESPHPDAVEFRNISQDYPVYALAEALAEGIVVGHPDMPVFQFEPDEIDALLEYLELIQAPQDT